MTIWTSVQTLQAIFREADWTCGCGQTNGVNLATCAVCERPRRGQI